MGGGAWWAAVHGVTRSQTQLSDFTFTFHFDALEKEMATHSSVLAWRIPGTEEPSGLPSMGSHRVRHKRLSSSSSSRRRYKIESGPRGGKEVGLGLAYVAYLHQFSSVQFSRSVVSDSLQPQGLHIYTRIRDLS